MKALTLWQPYATLIMEGVKWYETRLWRPPRDLYVLAIHAGLRLDADGQQQIAHIADPRRAYPRGVVLGVVHVIHAHHTKDLPAVSADELILGDFSPGRFAWELEVLEVFDEPIPAKGKQGFWEWEREAT